MIRVYTAFFDIPLSKHCNTDGFHYKLLFNILYFHNSVHGFCKHNLHFIAV